MEKVPTNQDQGLKKGTDCPYFAVSTLSKGDKIKISQAIASIFCTLANTRNLMPLITVPPSVSSIAALNDGDGMSTTSSAAPVCQFITPMYIIPKKSTMANLSDNKIKQMKLQLF